jgi:hypothetical protein
VHDANNKPMKGVNVWLNAELLNFLAGCMEDLYGEKGVWSDDVADTNPKKILDALGKLGWERTKDAYGDKAIKSTHYPASTPPLVTDELRATVVLKRSGVLALDIRPFGMY